MKILIRDILIDFQWYWADLYPNKNVPEPFCTLLKKIYDWSRNEK